MFVAKSICEAPAMAALARNGDRFFHAMEISGFLPWFIVTATITEGDERYGWTVCCAWDRDVADICRPVNGREVRSIQQVCPSGDRSSGWQLRNIAKLWHARQSQGLEVVVLEDDDGQEFCGEFGAAPPHDLGPRELLFTAATPAAPKAARKPRNAASGAAGNAVAARPDSVKGVSASEFGHLLGGVSEMEVLLMEARGELFSIKGEGDVGRLYPAYQAWPEVPRTVFVDVLKILNAGGEKSPHSFFNSLNNDLGWLAPVEVLIGAPLRHHDQREDAPAILALSADERHRLVIAAAHTHIAVINQW
jgi:hypothetical protein